MANLSPWAQIQQDAAPPPPGILTPVQMPDTQGPPVLAPTQHPAVTRPQTPQEQLIDQDQQRLQKVRWEQQNPWGTPENHPGKLGKLAHIFSQVGNIAGDVFAPGTMALIPGTEAHRQAEETGLTRRLNTEIGDESQNQEHNALTAKTQEDTAEEPGKTQSEEALQGAQTSELQSRVANGPDLATAYAHAVNQAIKNGVDPASDPIVQYLDHAITAIQKQPLPKGKEHVNLQGPDGKPYGGTFDPAAGKYYDAGGKEIPNPVPYEKPINVNAGNNELDRLTARFAKPYDTENTNAQAKLARIDQTLRSIDAGYVGQGLAIPELLTSVVSGQGTGVRITQAELNAITAHRGIKGDAESWFNSIAGKGNLTDSDRALIRNVLNDAKARLLEKQQVNNDILDSINGAASREQVLQAEKRGRAIMSGMERYLEIRRTDDGHYYGSNDGGKTTYDVETGKTVQ